MIVGWLIMTIFTVVQLNCENLFDCADDPLTQDEQFLPSSDYHWTPTRYWNKLNRVAQTIISCGQQTDDWSLPDLVALCEVENDSCMVDLTRRSLLRKARYEYLMTHSADPRGIDVALLYAPLSFRPIRHFSLRIKPPKGMHPTRDILYVSGQTAMADTLHVFVVHAPSRAGGEPYTRPYRRRLVDRLLAAVDSLRALSADPRILIMGDFNDMTSDQNIQLILRHGMHHVSADAQGSHGARGTYRFRGQWGSLDHIIADRTTAGLLSECRINDAPFLLIDDERYGGVQPFRSYLGPRYLNGFSDHLPLVARFEWKKKPIKKSSRRFAKKQQEPK